MNPKALEKAEQRLRLARNAIDRISAARDFRATSDAWSEFLVATNGVFTQISVGSRANPTSNAWYGKKKSERDRDPLLIYVQQARHADEHGLEPVLLHQAGSLSIGGGGPGLSSSFLVESLIITTEGVRGSMKSLDGNPIGIQFQPPAAGLIRVSNRGVDYDPPTSHLGTMLTELSPLSVAQAAYAYCEALLSEARTLS